MCVCAVDGSLLPLKLYSGKAGSPPRGHEYILVFESQQPLLVQLAVNASFIQSLSLFVSGVPNAPVCQV